MLTLTRWVKRCFDTAIAGTSDVHVAHGDNQHPAGFMHICSQIYHIRHSTLVQRAHLSCRTPCILVTTTAKILAMS